MDETQNKIRIQIMQKFHKEVLKIIMDNHTAIQQLSVDTKYGNGMRITLELGKL